MKSCQPCGRAWSTWSGFGRHMTREHSIDRGNFWRRANQIGDEPCVAVLSEAGRWYLMVQGALW